MGFSYDLCLKNIESKNLFFGNNMGGGLSIKIMYSRVVPQSQLRPLQRFYRPGGRRVDISAVFQVDNLME